jgi:hypothetical protein
MMPTFADKTQEKKSPSASQGDLQWHSSGESGIQVVDNRPEAMAQRKLQALADTSTRVSQLRAFQDMANSSPPTNETAQRQETANHTATQEQQPDLDKENNTGLPDELKTGMENLSGLSLHDVKVHRNSDKPAHLQAHAYAQGTDIHLGPGQEKHLSHEAWHVVQQKQGRVRPTLSMKDKPPINDDKGLEQEADRMGAKAEEMTNTGPAAQLKEQGTPGLQTAQLQAVKIKSQVFANHGVYDENHVKEGIIPGGSVIEVNPNDSYMMEDKTYVRITDGLNLIKFSHGDIGNTDILFVSDSAFSPAEAESEVEDEDEAGTELAAGPIKYQDGAVTIPILGQELEINKSGGSLSGALPSTKFEANLPQVSLDIDIPFAPGVYATAGLAITPSLGLEVSGGSYTIKVEESEKSISIEDASVTGSVGLEIKASAGVGVGAANLVGLDAGIFGAVEGKAALAGKLGGVVNFTDSQYNVVLGVHAAADIEGKVGAFVKAKFGFLSARKDFDIAKKTFAHFDYERTLALGSSQDALKPSITDFTKTEYGDKKSSKKLKTVDGKTYQELA